MTAAAIAAGAGAKDSLAEAALETKRPMIQGFQAKGMWRRPLGLDREIP